MVLRIEQYPDPQAFKTVLQADGNLCTYPIGAGSAAPVWCAFQAPAPCQKSPCQLWAALGDNGRFCVYHGAVCSVAGSKAAGTPVWCSA